MREGGRSRAVNRSGANRPRTSTEGEQRELSALGRVRVRCINLVAADGTNEA